MTYCGSMRAVVVFGGFDGSTRLNDVHVLSLLTLEWKKLSASGDVPSPRCQHAATWARVPIFTSSGRTPDDLTSVAPRVLVHGGLSEEGLADSAVYCLDAASGVWTVRRWHPFRLSFLAGR